MPSKLADQIVSVRMPVSLLNELKILAEKNHFLDVSEEVRSLLRDKWLEHSDPRQFKVYAVKKSIEKVSRPEQIKALKDTLKLLEEINEL